MPIKKINRIKREAYLMSKQGINRREFLGKTAAGIIAAPLGFSPLGRGKVKTEDRIITRTLGRTGLRIPVVSFGVMNSDSAELIHRALDRGINHLDTAHGYLRGNSERVIGEVLQDRGKRDKVYVATKMRFARDRKTGLFIEAGSEQEPGATPENLFRQLEISLQRLRTDYVDILYLHSCSKPAMVNHEPLMKALVKAKEQGKARFIGISTHSDEPNVIRASVDAGIYDVVLTTYNFAQEHREEVKTAIAYAAGKGVGIIAMKTQGGRRLQEKGEIEINHAAALKWVLSDENVCTTIPGMTAFEQLDHNLGVMGNMALTPAESRDLQLASLLPGKMFCQNCRSCVPTCPHAVEVPTLIRAYMYTQGYGNRPQAEDVLSRLPREQGLNTCRACDACVAACRHGINIGGRVRTLLADGLVAV